MIVPFVREVRLEEDLIAELNKVLDRLNFNQEVCDKQDFDPEITTEHCQKRVSREALEEVQSWHERNVATADENVLRLPPEYVKETAIPKMLETFVAKVCNTEVGEGIFHITGKFWYPSNGYMGWHTNNAYPGYRLYCTHADESNKSFFRYLDPFDGSIVTSWDRVGWMGRLFRIDKDEPLWHCVYSGTNRISTGCNLELDSNFSKDWAKLGGRA